MKKSDALKIVEILAKEYPELPRSFLEFENPFQLIISVILSAQCTDKMVNTVTPGLFGKYPDAKALAAADPEDVMGIIKPTGFYKNKSKNIINCAAEILKKHGGQVPGTMEELVELPGVGRKTANVVLQIAFDKTVGIVVDTHVKRLSQRLGFSAEDDPEKIEADLMAALPEDTWKNFSFYLIFHGRNVCDARSPECEICKLSDYCEHFNKNLKGEKKPKTKKAPEKRGK